MRLAKLILALTAATVTLAAYTTTASANHLSSSTQTFRATWSRFEYIGGFGTITCSLTLEDSLHSRTISKTAGLLMGAITRASVGPCASGSATVLQASLPWHVQYAGFRGTLPAIPSITTNIIGFAYQIREPTFGAGCLLRSSATSPATGTYNLVSGSVTSVTLGGSIACGEFATLSFGGTSTTNSAQTITLI